MCLHLIGVSVLIAQYFVVQPLHVPSPFQKPCVSLCSALSTIGYKCLLNEWMNECGSRWVLMVLNGESIQVEGTGSANTLRVQSVFGERGSWHLCACREGWGRKRFPGLWGDSVRDRYSGGMVEICNVNIWLVLVRKIIYKSEHEVSL